jgi:dolichyl-phosphate-mannose--protein O-mannosyl transferase
MNTWSLAKKPKIYNGEKKASLINDAGVIRGLYVEKWKYIHTHHFAQSSSSSGPQAST